MREGNQEMVMALPTNPEAEGSSIFEHISTHWPVIGDPFRFVLRYSRAVRRYVAALIKNEHDAEDVVQDFRATAMTRPFAPDQIRRAPARTRPKAMPRHPALTPSR